MTNDKMRTLSGNITGDRLDAFLYVLMRDHITTGTMEAIMDHVEKINEDALFTNGFLGMYAKQLHERLTT